MGIDIAIHQLIQEKTVSIFDRLVQFRRNLHQNPELSGDEKETAAKIAEYLNKLGLEVHTGIGGHGVIGILNGSLPGPVLAWRADIDACKSDAPDPVDFPSKVAGVRHICGHDLHTTIGLGIAQVLSSLKEKIAGTRIFIFQPAEENLSGAEAMLADSFFLKNKSEMKKNLLTSVWQKNIRELVITREYSTVYNDPQATEQAQSILHAIYGDNALLQQYDVIPYNADDFARFQQEYSGVYFFLGASNAKNGVISAPHAPFFAVDEEAIKYGVNYFSSLLMEYR